MRITPYREAVGDLMWAATMTRPDVAYAAHQLGKFSDNPGPAHWTAGEKGTTIPMAHEGRWDHLRRNTGVVHKTVGMGGRRSRHLPRHSAFGFRRSSDAERGAISWFSRVQKVTAAASSELEYVALAEVVNELRLLR